jgi:hypothetical protein
MFSTGVGAEMRYENKQTAANDRVYENYSYVHAATSILFHFAHYANKSEAIVIVFSHGNFEPPPSLLHIITE